MKIDDKPLPVPINRLVYCLFSGRDSKTEFNEDYGVDCVQHASRSSSSPTHIHAQTRFTSKHEGKINNDIHVIFPDLN